MPLETRSNAFRESDEERGARLTRLFEESFGNLEPKVEVISKSGVRSDCLDLNITNWENAMTHVPEVKYREKSVTTTNNAGVTGGGVFGGTTYGGSTTTTTTRTPIGFTRPNMDPALDNNSFRIRITDPLPNGENKKPKASIVVPLRINGPDGELLENVEIKLQWNKKEKYYESQDLVLVSSVMEDDLKTKTLPKDDTAKDQTFLAVPGATLAIDYKEKSYTVANVPVRCEVNMQPFILSGGNAIPQEEIAERVDRHLAFSNEVFAQAGVVIRPQQEISNAPEIPGMDLNDGNFDRNDHEALEKYLKEHPQGNAIPVFYANVDVIDNDVVNPLVDDNQIQEQGYYFSRSDGIEFIVVSTRAPLNTFAHEMGHKMGLSDFNFEQSLETPVATENFRKTNIMAYDNVVVSETGDKIIPDSKRYLSNEQIETIHNNMNCRKVVAPEQAPSLDPQNKLDPAVPNATPQKVDFQPSILP
ncbi:MAG: hypothetical protein K1X66_03130 [Verrucomicrobiae bacterium]|nr:hypothetical protein [Verrucomicrobiae bacterium]